MPDVNSFAPISPTPWGHLNDASNPEATEEPKAPAQQVDFDSFDDWNVNNASGDELGDLQNYGDYLRGKHAEKNQATVGFEQDLRNTLYGAAIQRGLVNPEDGDEVNTAKLFPAPELSTDASLKLISESPSAEITAIAANNLDALPEGTSPEDVHQDILTYRAKQKAFANSMATDPEATESNQEIKDDLEFWKSKAEGYTTGKIYDRAVKSALLDGRVAAARITREDGSSYVQIGKAASGKNAKEIIDLGKDYGVTLQDAAHITKQLETPEGFRHQTYDIIRKQEVGDVVDSILESDFTAPLQDAGQGSSNAEAVSAVVGGVLMGPLAPAVIPSLQMSSSKVDGTQPQFTQQGVAQKQFDRFVKLYKSYDDAVIDDDKENVQRLEKLLDNETLSIYSTMSSMDPTLGSMDMELDEFKTILTQRAGDQLLGSGQFKLQDDPTKMGMNIKKYGYGPAQMHRSLVSNVAKFEQSINANTDLTEADKVQLRANREAMSAQNFDSANELLSKGADAEEWLGTLQEGRAAGTKDHVILEGFLADPDNYSQFEARAKGVGAAWGQGFVSMVTAPMAMAGNEWAREQLIEANQRNAQRRERARLFGVEFGVGQDVMETIGPVFADMAVTAALTATTGAGGVMFLAAKQGAKLGAKNVTKGIVKSMTFNSPFKRLVVNGVEESSEVALERLVKDGYILEPATAEIKKGAMGAIDSFGKIASNKWTQEAAINIPSFSRSAGANYAATYDTLTQMNPDMSHEEKHDRAFGSGIVAGFSTIAIMKGFRSIGRGGIEDAFIKGMTKREAHGVMERLGNMGSRVKLGSEDSTKIFANAMGKIHKDMAKGVGKFAGPKNIVSEAFDGFTSEALEEGLDEFVNSYITDYYTDQSTDGMARLESAYRAALTGGIIGSGMGAYQKLAGRSGLREQSRRDQARLELDFIDNVVAELDTADAPNTGRIVRDILTGPARGKRADEARAKLTQELDPSATPKATEKAASAEKGAPSEPAPFVPKTLEGPAAERARLQEELDSIDEAAQEQTFLTSDQLQRKKEIEATLKLDPNAPQADTTTPAPKDPRSESQKLSHDKDKLNTLPPNSWFTTEGSASAELNEEQQARYDSLVEEEMNDDQYKLFEEVDPADTSGLFRSLQIAEAIVDGTLTKDEDGNIVGFPESNDVTLDEVGTRQRMADWLNQEGEGALAGRLTPEEAEENLLKGPDADYMLDVENYVIGVRDPDTGNWVGMPIMSELEGEFLANLDGTVNPESVQRTREEVQLELFEKGQIEEKVIVKSAPILDNLTEEESQVVQQELNLGDGTSVRGADIDALAPVTREEVEEAAEQGVDLDEVNEQMLINLDKEGRVVESEEDADIPMEAGTAEAPVTEVLEFLDTEEDQASFEALVSSGFPSRVTAKTKSGFKYSKKTKGYYPRVSTEVARQIYDTWPVTTTTEPEGGKVFEGRKQVHYNPHTKKMSSSKGAPVKGFLDSSDRGVFDNDPVLTAEYLKAGVVVIVPEGVEQLNPSIIIDPDTRRVLSVLSVNNENEGMLQDGADPDKVTSTQANYNTVLKKGAASGLFDQALYETPLEIDEAPQANGTKAKVPEGQVFTVGDYINNVVRFVEDAMIGAKGSVRGALENLINPTGVVPLKGDFFDAAAQRFVVENILVANAYVARKNILDGPVGKLLTPKLNKDGTIEVDKDGNFTGNLQLRNDTAANRSKLINAFKAQTRLRDLTGKTLDAELKAIVSGTSGSSYPKRTTNFILQEIINHPKLRKNTMPPMKFIAELSADNFRKQQKAKRVRDMQNNAERSQFNADTDTSIPAVSTDPVSRDDANNVIDQDSDVAESLYESEEARAILVDLATELAGGSQDVTKLLSRMDTQEIAAMTQLGLNNSVGSKKLQTILGRLESSNPDMYKVLTEGYNVVRTGTPRQNKDHNTNARNVVKKNQSRSRIAESQRKIARAANQAEAERLGLVSGDVNSVVSALQKIAETGTTAHKLVANLILENVELVRDVKFTIISANLPFAGMQTTMTDGSLEVVLNLDGHNGRGLSNVLLEEYVHATLTKILSQPRSSLTPAQLAAVTRLDALRQEISEAASAAGYRANSALMDSLVNMDEFVAGVMLSPELQAEIKGLGADKGGRGLFRKIMDSILEFFGKGVTTKEASTYADALTDVIDLAQSTVSVSDPRAKTRAKRVVAEVTANMKATSDAFKATGVPAVYSDPSLAEAQQDVELTEDELIAQKAAEDLNELVSELTEVDTDTEGVTNQAQISEAQQKAEALLRVARELVPPEVPLEIDRTINAAAEFRDGVVVVNPAFIMNLTQDLGLASSKLIVAKVMSHELSHVASFNTLTQEEIDELADTLPDYMYEEVVESYYADRPEQAAEALALIRATDLDEQGQADLLDLKARLTEEHLRMRMEVLTSGFTTEQDWAFYRTNPSLMKIMFRYVSGYFRRMAEMRKFQKELNNGEGNRFMDSAVNSLIHELRSIKAGYRTQESSIAFDPTRPDQGLAVLADKLEEGLTTDPEEFLTRSDGLQAAIAKNYGYAKPSEYGEEITVTPLNAKGEPKNQQYNLIGAPFFKTAPRKDQPYSQPLDYDSLHYKVGPRGRKDIQKLIDSGAVDAAVERLVEETNKMMERPDVAAGLGWYTRMQSRLKEIFTEEDLVIFTNLLGATSANTGVEQNFIYAAEIYQRYKSGEFDSNIKQYLELYDIINAGTLVSEAVKRQVITAKQAKTIKAQDIVERWVDRSGMTLTQSYDATKKFGQNSMPSLRVLAGVWRENTKAPKTPQFAMNLRGESLEATIDVWAARTLRRILYAGNTKRWRIIPKAETGVKNQDFALGQIVFREAAQKLNMSPDDLQAVVWFGEKQTWDENGWTGETGAFKSSFDDAADVFYPKDRPPRTFVEGRAIIKFLQKERLYLFDQTLDPEVLSTSQKQTLRTHEKEYKQAKLGTGVQSYIESRGRGEVSQRVEGEREGTREDARRYTDGRSLQSAIGAPLPRQRREDLVVGGAKDSYGGDAGGHLKGLPVTVRVDGTPTIFTGYKPAQDVAEKYQQQTGIGETPISYYAPVNEKRAARIARAFDKLQHNPSDPEVAEAYQALIAETYAQYDAMIEAGVKLEFAPSGKDPYKNPRNAILDVVENNHMYVFGTKDGFGSDSGFDPSDNPLLEVSPYTWGGREVLANDIFRAVHDYFGHIRNGVGFRARGEENAWRSHSTMYSKAARRALTTETRAQNSWVNYGPYGEFNQTATGEETIFADQKIGLLPEWVMETEDAPRTSGLQSAIGNPNQYDEQFMEEALMSGAVRGGLERMPQSVRNALKRQEYLGFDSATEAFANIIQYDNWNEMWEITSPSDQGIINRYRNKIYGQTAEDVRFRRSLGLQSAIAPSEGFTPDKMDYSGFIDQLELPFYATGGYDAPTSLIGRILKGALDPRIERMIQNRQFFRNAAEKTANSFKTKFDRLMKEAYGDQLDSSDTARLNKAIGRSAIVPRERRKEIEEEYQAELDTIAQTTYESTKERKLDEQIAADNKFGKLLAEKQVIAKQIIAEQTQALAELEEVSPELAQTIRDIRTELIEPIQEKMKDLYGMDEGMKAHFDVQKGIYLTTQYRMFTETGFHEHASKSPEYAGIREEAGKYFIEDLKLKRRDQLREQAKIAGLVFNPQEADLIVEAEFQEQSPDSLKTMGQLEVDKFLAQYKRAGKNDVVSNDDAKILEDNLKEKKDLDPRLRALLGEVGAEATVDNLVRTFLTVSTMAANQAMFSNIQKMGQKEGFLMTAKQLKAARKKDPEAYEDWDAVTPKKTSANNPLRGMYAPEHVREGLVELFKSDINTETDTDSEKVVGFMTSTLRQASGLSMATKTLGSIGFYIRNMLSNMVFFGPSQGFVNGASMIAKTKYVWDELKDPNRMDAYLTELSALGVIDNEIRSTLMKDMLNGTRSLSDVISEQNKLVQSAAKGTEATFGKIYKVATRMAGAVDGFYKIAYYENELKVLRKARAKAEKEGGSFANYSDSDLKQMARDKVLMTAQSSSQAPPIVKDIASHGIGALVAPFIRFKAEVPRVVFNTFKLASQEIKSDSSVIRARGFQRMGGMLAVGGGSMGVVAAILASFADTDDEDMQDFQRETAPEYLRGNSFLSIPPKWNKFLGGGDKYKTIDLTFINPYALLADPVVRAFEKMGRGEFGEAGAALVNGLFVDQYLDEQIAAGALTAVIENRDPTNNKPIVENVSDTTGEAAIKRLTFLFNEAYSPDVLKRAIKAYQTATSDEVYTDPENSVQNILYGAFRPFKVHTIDPERQLKNYLYESRREFANIKSRKNILRSLKPISEQSIVEIFEEEYEDRQAVSNHAIRMMRGASKYGMSDKHIYQTASEVLAKRRTKNLMNGVMDGINLTPDFTQRMMATAKTEEEKQMKLARIKEAYKWINANPKKYLLSEGSLLKRKKTQ